MGDDTPNDPPTEGAEEQKPVPHGDGDSGDATGDSEQPTVDDGE